MQTLYCSGVFNQSTIRSSGVLPDVFIADNDSLSSNATDLQTNDQTSDVERRVTETVYLVTRYCIYHGITPIILIAGVVGNLMSLLFGVRYRRHMSPLERSASAGLVALVTSDLLFCVVGLPQLFVPKQTNPLTPPASVLHARFGFYYQLYRGPLHNVFLLCSTWIVAIITSERFLVVSRPIHARFSMIRLHRTLLFYAGVFVLAGLVALPLFLKNRAVEADCFPGCRCIFMVPSTFGSMRSRRVYNVIWMLIGVVLPLGVLLVAGTKLVQALRAQRRQNEAATVGHARHQTHHSQFSRVTTTVIGTAVSFIILVCPSIVVESVGLIVGVETLSHSQVDVYRTVIVLLNLCQTIKFAGNFVFFIRLRDCNGCGRLGTARDHSAMDLCRLRSAEGARSTRQTEQAGVTYGRLSVNSSWPETARHVQTTSTPALV